MLRTLILNLFWNSLHKLYNTVILGRWDGGGAGLALEMLSDISLRLAHTEGHHDWGQVLQNVSLLQYVPFPYNLELRLGRHAMFVKYR